MYIYIFNLNHQLDFEITKLYFYNNITMKFIFVNP